MTANTKIPLRKQLAMGRTLKQAEKALSPSSPSVPAPSVPLKAKNEK